MTLEQWDKEVQPHLHFIEAGASMALRHARALPCRAEWETLAQDDLERARHALESALASVMAAESTYERKPLEREIA